MTTAQAGFRDRTAVCGVGMTRLGDLTDRTAMSLAVESFTSALDDAGLSKTDVDGLMVLSGNVDYDRFLETVGLDVRHAYQGWTHGRFVATMIEHAAMAVYLGLASCVAIVNSRRRSGYGQPVDTEMWRQGQGPHGERAEYGALAPAFGAALGVRRYFHRYGRTDDDLAHVAVALRHNATLNPDALRREPLTVDSHHAAPWVVEPLRRLDCCQNNDGAACLLVTTAERARDLRKPAVYLSAMQGVHFGRQSPSFALPNFGVGQQEDGFAEPDVTGIYDAAGISRADVSALGVYDAFTPLVLYSLERFGFCGPGEAGDFVRDGRISVGGELPVNTSGGLLSEGHIAGWNLFVEIVRQLRHECGDRQVRDAEIIQWANYHGDSIVFRR